MTSVIYRHIYMENNLKYFREQKQKFQNKLNSFRKDSNQLQTDLMFFEYSLQNDLKIRYLDAEHNKGIFNYHKFTSRFPPLIKELNNIINAVNTENNMIIQVDTLDDGTLAIVEESKLPLYTVSINEIPVDNGNVNSIYGFVKKTEEKLTQSEDNLKKVLFYYQDKVKEMENSLNSGGKRRSIRTTKAQRSRKKKLRKRRRTRNTKT